MNKLSDSAIIIILGVIITSIGFIQAARYESAIKNGYKIEAAVVEVVMKEEYDSEESKSYTTYTAYADYEADGKEYKHIRIGKSRNISDYRIGNTVEIAVDPSSSEK